MQRGNKQNENRDESGHGLLSTVAAIVPRNPRDAWPVFATIGGTRSGGAITMGDTTNYAVFLFPPAIEALGDSIKPYLPDGPLGPHIVCSAIDASGAFFQVTVPGRDKDGNTVEAELMLPNAFVRFAMSLHNDHRFGFGENP
jgi:hypothetical protein